MAGSCIRDRSSSSGTSVAGSAARVVAASWPRVGEATCADEYTKYSTQYVIGLDLLMSVPHALLALLSEGPKYGLRLQTEFESRTGEVWPLNVGQVYTTLQRLERDGLVETDGEGERSRKRYRITSAGAHELADWLRTPPELVPPPRDELVIKVLVALQVPGINIHEILQTHRRHVIEVMQRYTRIKADAAEDDVPLALVADAELFRLEAIVRWLDAADVRLKQQRPLAPAAVADTPLEPAHPMEVSQ
jgi:DNA-binding PadR family transcriptional regulator